MIALLTGVIPNLVRLVLSPVWGHLFDRMNFFALRVTLNVGFAIGILTFFLSDTLTGLVIGRGRLRHLERGRAMWPGACG